MRNDQLSIQSMDFAISIIILVKGLKAKHTFANCSSKSKITEVACSKS